MIATSIRNTTAALGLAFSTAMGIVALPVDAFAEKCTITCNNGQKIQKDMGPLSPISGTMCQSFALQTAKKECNGNAKAQMGPCKIQIANGQQQSLRGC